MDNLLTLATGIFKAMKSSSKGRTERAQSYKASPSMNHRVSIYKYNLDLLFLQL